MRWGQTVPLGVRGRSPLSPLEVLAAACSSLPPRQGSCVPTVPAGSTRSPTRARGFAPVGLLSCSKGLNAFKAIKQGLSKDFARTLMPLNATYVPLKPNKPKWP